MFVCECGNNEFHTIGNESVNFYYNGDGDHLDTGDYVNSEIPMANTPYTCTQCNREYSCLPPQNPEREWLDQRERAYIARKGTNCPICGGSELDGESFQIDGSHAWQKISCLEPDCGAEWTDTYNLSGVEIDSYPTSLIPESAKPPEVPNPNEVFKK